MKNKLDQYVGKLITVFCQLNSYTDILKEVKVDCIQLEDTTVILNTNFYVDINNSQKTLPNKIWIIGLDKIESFGVV